IEAERSGARQDSNMLLLLLALVFILSVIIINRGVNHLLVAPLHGLTEMVQRFSRDRVVPETPPSYAERDEIGTLAHAFWRMTDELQRTTVSRDYVDNIIRSMSDALVVVAPDGIIRSVNPTMCALLGAGEEELVGQPMASILVLEEGSGEAGDQRFIVDGGGIERQLRSHDGRLIPVLLSVSTMVDRSGLPQGIVCLMVDMTERKAIEETLRQSEEQLKQILDSIHAGIMVIDPVAHEIVSVNTFAANMLGLPKEEILGRVCHRFVCSAEIGNCPITDRKEEVDNSERTLIRGDGSFLPILKSVVPVRFQGRQLLIESFIDITERKANEDALRESEYHLQTILDSVRTGIVVADPERHRIVYANPFMANLLATSREDLVDMKCHDLICEGAPGHCPIVEEGVVVENYERLLNTSDGRSINVMESCVPIMYQGRPCYIESFIDISRLKESEKQLKRYADDVREANDEVRNFSYIVSHDLRAPLVSIKGFSVELKSSLDELNELLAGAVAALPHDKRQQVETILQQDVGEAIGFIGSSVARMDGQISAILNLSRLGRRELKPITVDANKIVGTILSSLAHQLESKRVQVTVDPLPQLQCDQVALEQIFGNLLDNALKYLDPGRDGTLHIRSEAGQGEITFHVADNGRGIAVDDQPKVFELFRRAGKQDTPGEGMGLTYVKTLVKRQGGRIWLASELGAGSTFSFTLPA
ncbi:MAG TPA: PAS domain S-box protein, partial [Geobacterales bacterium]|nr:PAS domain S-box protein [Geobacterales bacterium]